MFDILIFLFDSYFTAGNYPEPEKLSIKLTAAGFEEDDIHSALAWLSTVRQLSEAEYPESINRSGPRYFADFEKQRISSNGLQFISFLESNKIITPVEREMIIDRAVALGRESLSTDKVKLITLMVLWSQHDDLDPLLIEDLLAPSNSNPIH
jgi:Smg protein